MAPPSLGSPLHHQDKLLIHISLGHGGLEVWALQETQEKLIYQLGEGTDKKVSLGTASRTHSALGPSSISPGLKETPSPLLGSLLKLRSMPSPSLIPADVATKAQGWAHPLQGQIQGSHWVAGSGRYSLRSEGQSQGSLRKSPGRQKLGAGSVGGNVSSKVLMCHSTCASEQFTPWRSLPEHAVHRSPGPGAGDPGMDKIHPCPL